MKIGDKVIMPFGLIGTIKNISDDGTTLLVEMTKEIRTKQISLMTVQKNKVTLKTK